jgi:FAD/FMN-containing dehydrogenase
MTDRVSRRTALKMFGAAAGSATVFGVTGGLFSPVAGATEVIRPTGTTVTGSGLTGRVVLPGDATYEAERRGWDSLFSSYPSVIVFVQSADDVVSAVAWARTHDTALRVRSGRHSLEGWSNVDGGIVIDVSGLKSIDINRNAKTATVGTGVTQGELVAALAGTGLGFPTGDEAGVGLGGAVLGGGIGLLSRAMGVSCDNLEALEMVVPSGRTGARIVRADETKNSDLLWASRGGGGGNFGLATSFTLRLHPLPDPVTIFKINWGFDALHGAFDAWQGWAPNTDPRIGSTLVVLKPLNGLEVNGVFLGSQAVLGHLLAPLTGVAGAKVQISSSSWADRYASLNSGPRQNAYWKFTPAWAYRKLSSTALDTVGEFMTKAPADACNFWSLAWGGAVMKPPKGGSAFYHRKPLYYAEPGAGWNDPSVTSACVTWIGEFREAMLDHVEGGYVNVPDRAIAEFGTSYYGTNYPRLRKIKAAYDPYDVFQFEQSIQPA